MKSINEIIKAVENLEECVGRHSMELPENAEELAVKANEIKKICEEKGIKFVEIKSLLNWDLQAVDEFIKDAIIIEKELDDFFKIAYCLSKSSEG